VTVLDSHVGYSLLSRTDISNVSSSATERVSLSSTQGNTMTLAGATQGSATISFSGRSSGETRDDTFVMDVETPTAFNLQLDCSVPVAIRGERAVVSFSFEPFSVGEGYYPIVVDPPEAATLDVERSNYRRMVLDVADDAPGQFTISVDPASGLSGETVTLNVQDEPPQLVNISSPRQVDTLDVSPLSQVTVLPAGAELSSTYCTAYPVRATTVGPCGFIVDGAFTREANVLSSDLALIALEAGSCIVAISMFLADIELASSQTVDLTSPPAPSSGSSGGGGGGGSGFDFD
jgi:hypothetical protein